MSRRQEPIEDYYGTLISVQVVGHSAGFMVDLERESSGGEELNSFDSLTAEQARDLAQRLLDAAEEAE